MDIRKLREKVVRENTEWLESPENHGLTIPFHRLFCPGLSKSAPCGCCGGGGGSGCTACACCWALLPAIQVSDSRYGGPVPFCGGAGATLIFSTTGAAFSPDCFGAGVPITTQLNYNLSCIAGPPVRYVLSVTWWHCSGGNTSMLHTVGGSGFASGPISLPPSMNLLKGTNCSNPSWTFIVPAQVGASPYAGGEQLTVTPSYVATFCPGCISTLGTGRYQLHDSAKSCDWVLTYDNTSSWSLDPGAPPSWNTLPGLLSSADYAMICGQNPGLACTNAAGGLYIAVNSTSFVYSNTLTSCSGTLTFTMPTSTVYPSGSTLTVNSFSSYNSASCYTNLGTSNITIYDPTYARSWAATYTAGSPSYWSVAVGGGYPTYEMIAGDHPFPNSYCAPTKSGFYIIVTISGISCYSECIAPSAGSCTSPSFTFPMIAGGSCGNYPCSVNIVVDRSTPGLAQCFQDLGTANLNLYDGTNNYTMTYVSGGLTPKWSVTQVGVGTFDLLYGYNPSGTCVALGIGLYLKFADGSNIYYSTSTISLPGSCTSPSFVFTLPSGTYYPTGATITIT